jgi:hypothetical protein
MAIECEGCARFHQQRSVSGACRDWRTVAWLLDNTQHSSSLAGLTGQACVTQGSARLNLTQREENQMMLYSLLYPAGYSTVSEMFLFTPTSALSKSVEELTTTC